MNSSLYRTLSEQLKQIAFNYFVAKRSLRGHVLGFSSGSDDEDEIQHFESSTLTSAYFYYDFTETLYYKDDTQINNFKVAWRFTYNSIDWGVKPSGINVESGSIIFD